MSQHDSVTVSLIDSASSAAYEDSVLDNPSQEFTVLPNGDTLKSVAGMMMDENQAPNLRD